MIQSAPVLPSNGSPILNAENGRTSRVLQEQSSNRQHNDYPYVDGSEQKYSSLLSENNYPTYHQRPQPRHVYHQTPLQRNSFRHSSSRYQVAHDSHDARAWAEKQARHLYERFRASDQYMKYRNRQQKDDKHGQEQKWPDRLEFAFFRALVYWPPMGRRQLPHKDKRRGRNELIADFIEELTGESRSRKQVSSHIQVLKPFVENDPEIMRWLSKHDMGQPAHHSRLYGGRAASSHYEGRRASCYPVAASVNAVAAPVAPMSHANSHELSKVRGHLAVFEPTDFQMFVQRKQNDTIHRLHDYTQSISNPRQEDEKPEDLASFTQGYPFAASLLSQRPPDCNIILAEASLAFPTTDFKDEETGKSIQGVELGISFLCKSQFLDVNADLICRNTFYKNGEPLIDPTSSPTKIHLTQSEDNSGVETQLKFGSTFWAKTLAFLATRLRDSDERSKSAEEVKDYIKGVNAYQEIFIHTEQGHERLLVICWSFRLSRDVRGKAYWRRLRLPHPSAHDYAVQPKNERVDSVFDYNIDFAGNASSIPQPSLQSPFEYDSSSGGSALPSATWPSVLADGTNTGPHSAIDFPGPSDNAFDFSGGNINISYTDPSIMDFGFDSSAFNFDTATADFVADPALQNYAAPTDSQDTDFPHTSQQTQDYSQPTDYSLQWCDSYTAFDSQQPLSAGASNYAAGGADSQSQVFDGYGGQYDHGYNDGPSDGQAYGGAGQDVNGREEDPLAALADASYMARVNLPPQQDGHDEQQQHQTQ